MKVLFYLVLLIHTSLNFTELEYFRAPFCEYSKTIQTFAYLMVGKIKS